jgi:predicted small secreted protein
MKKLALIVSLIAASFGLSSCCSMFGKSASNAGYVTETRQVKACGYDIVTEQVYVGSTGKGGMGSYETIEKRVPRYRTVTKKVKISCPSCVRLYCPEKDCCGSTSERFLKMVSLQGSAGSPNMGLVPSMKPLAP